MARSGPGPVTGVAVERDRAGVGRRAARRRTLSSVDLPQPEWPMSETNSPGSTVEVDAAQHVLRSRPCAVKDFQTPSIVQAHRRDLLDGDGRPSRRNTRSSTRPTTPMSTMAAITVARLPALYGVPDEEADAGAAGEHLDGDDHHPGDAHRQPQAGDDRRQACAGSGRGGGRRAGRTGTPGRRCAGRRAPTPRRPRC